MIQIGNDKIKDIYVGSDKIKEIYYGSEKVWGEIESIQDGYWVHKDTNAVTYFGLEDPSIVDGIMNTPSWAYNCSELQLPTGVISLGSECFAQCASLTSVTLPEGVTSLEDWCFRYCYSLTSITLPESLTSIGDNCFERCGSLSSIDIPEGVTRLGYSCFAQCASLTSITLPESLTSLEGGCFYRCQSLTSINIPEGVVSLGSLCFSNCPSLTSITIPESVTSIGEGCFYFCPFLTLATVLPSTPPSLGASAFDDVHESFIIKVRSPYVNDYKTATNWINYESIISAIGAGYWVHKDTGVRTYFDLTDPSITNGVMSPPSWRGDCSEVNIPVGVTSLGYACFSGSPFTSITLPESVTSLGQVCFSGCASLTSITLPESLTSIGGDCFAFCTALTSITLPESVTSLGEYCFQFCEALTLATVLPATPPSLGTSAFRGNHSSFNIKVRMPYVNDYKTATNWTSYADIISSI